MRCVTALRMRDEIPIGPLLEVLAEPNLTEQRRCVFPLRELCVISLRFDGRCRIICQMYLFKTSGSSGVFSTTVEERAESSRRQAHTGCFRPPNSGRRFAKTEWLTCCSPASDIRTTTVKEASLSSRVTVPG